uniref:Uncharacterized protein n=1 Tax=Ascaris lumbricoides TaxID=6252 RepID=A0A9J2PZF4_ASCLU
MEVENELEKTTTEEPDATEERLIFGKEEDEENDYDDATLRDIDKRSPGGHKRKSAQEGNAGIETSVNDITSTTEIINETTDDGENEAENDKDDTDANSDYDGQTSEQTSEDQNEDDSDNVTDKSQSEVENYEADFDVPNEESQTKRVVRPNDVGKREKRFAKQMTGIGITNDNNDEWMNGMHRVRPQRQVENYEADFDVPNEESQTKRVVRPNDVGKREKRFAKQMTGIGITNDNNDEWMNGMHRVRPQRQVNLADAVVIRVKRLSRAGSSHKKNKLNERRGSSNRGDDATANANTNTFTNDEINAQNTR